MRNFGGLAIGAIAIIGWIVITMTRIISRNRVREMMIRERIALIEKGLVPSPEVDPAGFERVMRRTELDLWPPRRAPGRHFRVGIILMGVGVGAFLVIGAGSGSFRQAMGPGGFLFALGVAFFIIGLFDERAAPMSPPSGMSQPPMSPTDSRRPE
jgi:hypothetical protein